MFVCTHTRLSLILVEKKSSLKIEFLCANTTSDDTEYGKNRLRELHARVREILPLDGQTVDFFAFNRAVTRA